MARAKRDPILEVFWNESSGEFYWRLFAPNGERIAAGGEGFTRARDAKRAALTAQNNMAYAVFRYAEKT